jgi:DNA-binding MarR family transcriptional regulator
MPEAPETTELSATAARLRLAIVRTARRLRQEAAGELSPSAVATLATVERHGPLTPSEVAAIERVKRPTATRSLAGLEGLGLVERTPDPSDGRSALVSVTAAGGDRLRRLRGRKNAYLARRLRGLSADEVATLERASELLERILEGERPARAEDERG